MERRTYTKEFKQEAVQLSYESELSAAQVAAHLESALNYSIGGGAK